MTLAKDIEASAKESNGTRNRNNGCGSRSKRHAHPLNVASRSCRSFFSPAKRVVKLFASAVGLLQRIDSIPRVNS
jgi:hypothetical protein